jgi:hypothetical protein
MTAVPLTRALKNAWVANLESGDYIPGQGYLRQVDYDMNDGHPVDTWCCLGVLADTYDPEAWDTPESEDAEPICPERFWYGESELLEQEAPNFGLSAICTNKENKEALEAARYNIPNGSYQQILSHMNDRDKAFPIEWIKKYVPTSD